MLFLDLGGGYPVCSVGLIKKFTQRTTMYYHTIISFEKKKKTFQCYKWHIKWEKRNLNKDSGELTTAYFI